ncbi:hypothetical protein G9A89_019150 [Geosiphon pyriformis]|nr:hypothetical protein G9A89_019150 [Geosiphon pyriformis]
MKTLILFFGFFLGIVLLSKFYCDFQVLSYLRIRKTCLLRSSNRTKNVFAIDLPEILVYKKVETAAYKSLSLYRPLLVSRIGGSSTAVKDQLDDDDPIVLRLEESAKAAKIASCLNGVEERLGPFFYGLCFFNILRNLEYHPNYQEKYLVKLLQVPKQDVIYVLVRGPKISIKPSINPRNKTLYGKHVPLAMVDAEYFKYFQDGVLSFSKLLKKEAEAIPFERYQLRFIGHGVGGVLAMFAALYLKRIKSMPKPKKLEVYTFGQPRMGNKLFALYVNRFLPGSVYRVTNMNDFVPKLLKSNTWYHHSTEYWINQRDCDCSASKEISRTEVYRCYGMRQYEDEHIEPTLCNADSEGTEESSIQAHFGPYFNYDGKSGQETIMANCPPLPID